MSKSKGKRRVDEDLQQQHVQFNNPAVKRAHFSVTNDSGTHGETRVLARLPTLPISSIPSLSSTSPIAPATSGDLDSSDDQVNVRKPTQVRLQAVFEP
jgi:hypothetical protein